MNARRWLPGAAMLGLLPCVARAFVGTAPPPIQVTLATLWEGEPLTIANTEAMREFRKSFAGVRMVHFVSPSYLARHIKDKQARETEKTTILSTFEKDDIAGLYLNGWKSTVELAGVTFRGTPTFWGNTLAPRHCVDDCGREVAMTAYPNADLRRLIRKSRELFAKNGLGSAAIMQVAGHAAGPEVLGAASAEGISHDFSAVAPELVTGRLFRFPLRKQLLDLWSGVGPMMSPFELDTGAGKIMEMTANGIHMEFMSAQEIRAHLDRVIPKESPKGDKAASTRHLYIGVPSETFAISRPKLELTLRELIQRASDTGTAIKWTAEVVAGAREMRPELPPPPTPVPTPMPTPTPTPTQPPSGKPDGAPNGPAASPGPALETAH